MVDELLKRIKQSFDGIEEHRYKNNHYSLSDYLSSSFSMFHLKDSSLHHYRINYVERSSNLERIYGIKSLPSDSAMREGIDGILPKYIQDCFDPLLQVIEKEGIINEYKVLGRYTAFSCDATANYSSCQTSCEHCLTKVHKNKKGEITKTTYHHQALAAILMHYNHKEVFPISCEAIVKQDGTTKNDCEQNAAKRLIPNIRARLPKSKYHLLGVFDGLYPNGPFIKLLQAHFTRFIIGIKEGYVLIQIAALKRKHALKTHNWTNEIGSKCVTRYYNSLILNGENQDIQVNYFEYEEFNEKGERLFYSSWITDLPIDNDTIEEMVKIARSRWKIENETFNTLKNQGYHLEHSYGHGTKYLATNLMLLTFLAFLTDQIVQKLDATFDKAWKYAKTKKNLWEKIRHVFDLLPCFSMSAIYRFIAKDTFVLLPMII
jgi:hypothetical protein